MAENRFFKVEPNFDLEQLASKLVFEYQAEGFQVFSCKTPSGCSISLKKNTTGMKKLLGLARVLTVNIAVNSAGDMIVDFSNEEWASKVCAIALGWWIVWIPFFTGIYGAVKQAELPKNIAKRIQSEINGYGVM